MKKFVVGLLVFGMGYFSVMPAVLAVTQQGRRIVIAVVDFKNNSGNPQLDNFEQAIPEALITNLARNERIEIVERTQLQNALSELQLSMSGIVDARTAVEVGRAVGATAILVGSFLQIEGRIQINARLIDVRTSRVLKAAGVRGRSGAEIFELMDRLAASIEARLFGKSVPQTQNGTSVNGASRQRSNANAAEKSGGSFLSSPIFWGAMALGAGAGAFLVLGATEDEPAKTAVTITISLPDR